MSNEMQIESSFRPTRASRGRKCLSPVPEVATEPAVDGRVPRVARLMALAIRFDRLIASGALKDLAEVARLGHVTRARATQVMNLTMLAPDIQEEILFLPRVEAGRDTIKEWQLRPIAATPDWGKQRKMWRHLATQPS